jgi:ribosome-binding protein aMBF1 (putative translation factor)
MPSDTHQPIDCRIVELDGVRYVILRESVFQTICQKAGVDLADHHTTKGGSPDLDLDQPLLADRLTRRRQAVGLSQAELARRAAVRPETLNRIERGRVTPDFATIRKLVVAINAAEQQQIALSMSQLSPKESEDVDAKSSLV